MLSPEPGDGICVRVLLAFLYLNIYLVYEYLFISIVAKIIFLAEN